MRGATHLRTKGIFLSEIGTKMKKKINNMDL